MHDRRALDHAVGPLFATPAIVHTKTGFIQISPADERCSLGELTIRKDPTRRWPELSGELFTVRPIDSTEHKCGRNWLFSWVNQYTVGLSLGACR
jgi:hypothetical protein